MSNLTKTISLLDVKGFRSIICISTLLINQNTETPTVNNQGGIIDHGILTTCTANLDRSTHTESTHSLLIPSLTDDENLMAPSNIS